jgi:hypothetical protein
MTGHDDSIKVDSTTFMLTEYTSLREFRQSLVSLGENRLNFFLTTVTGAFVGLGLINQLTGYDGIVFLVAGATIFALFAVGIITFVRMVERNIGITKYTRGMNRIRRWFTERDQAITPYLSLALTDDLPRFGVGQARSNLFGLPTLVAMINSLIAGIGIVLLATIVLNVALVWGVVSAIIMFAIIFFIHNQYYASRIRREEEHVIVNFPTKLEARHTIGK